MLIPQVTQSWTSTPRNQVHQTGLKPVQRTGYSQHLGAIEQNCEIRFCVKSNVFDIDGLPIVNRPPHMKPSKVYNYTVPMHIVNQDTGQVWFKPYKSPQWVLAAER